MAMAERAMAARYNMPGYPVFDNRTWVISGDGCLMEGVSAEAASLAGHHKLGKLTVFYDSNNITIEGSTDITFTEDVKARFRAYGWQTLEGSAHDVEEILAMTREAVRETEKPTLIVLKSIIGKGSPGMQGKHKVHGSRLGPEEAARTRVALGAPDGERMFHVHPEAYEYFAERRREWTKKRREWENMFEEWSSAFPEKRRALNRNLERDPALLNEVNFPGYKIGDSEATRLSGGKVLEALATSLDSLIGGSADLASSNCTEIAGQQDFTPENPLGKIIRYGVREHAMGSITNGLTLYGGLRPFAATLLMFVEYMRPAIRLAALMKLPVIYVLTHDSIFMGGDGPTHQPVEQLAGLRSIPNLRVIRPADPEETVEAWKMALERNDGPTALVLSRQNLAVCVKADRNWKNTIRTTGAYIVKNCEGPPEAVLFATGSEVDMALCAAQGLNGRRIRVVSVFCREMLYQSWEDVRGSLLPEGIPGFAAEAGSRTGWEVLTGGERRRVFGLDDYGASGRPEEVAEYFGYTAQKLADLLGEYLKK
jgi:transketolase